MKKLTDALPTALLVLLFVYAAAAKLADTEAFRGQLYNQAFPHELAGFLFYALPAIELVTVALLLYPATEQYGLLLSLVLLLAFTGYIALVLGHAFPRVPCSCGGILSHMGWKTHLAFNGLCLALNGYALWKR
jgi:putative oxidoreductase